MGRWLRTGSLYEGGRPLLKLALKDSYGWVPSKQHYEHNTYLEYYIQQKKNDCNTSAFKKFKMQGHTVIH